ncbi:hypothetical protein S140_173 [Shewanella sp. phage 1/40]|uniref:hypothetical protein n=1 Tax=Shewanella phage 1/4 TaxID=1458859 RepID=UPI0004F80873|nr:hypothetical protein S14_170 [Shewanella sp. phage 1/4]YP_009104171.1 hypothetical protein S140_173 [Shewanella sp. phage 1/40]AHK11279.1 hypothetical protein S14_170 [Shewanella sp. phage 1/4]AHK11580.1 hypothetical protein S140_173 [Shewanella sp. phage 1/40]
METFMQYFQDGLMYIGALVVLATAIVGALEKFAEVTPTTKDDEYVAKAKQYLGFVSAFLDKVSVWNTKK